MLKNKKADISIVLLVILCFLVCSIVLFLFSQNSDSIKKTISGVFSIKEVQANQNLGEFYLIQAGENALAKTYKEFVENNNYIDSPINYSKTDVEFKFLDKRLDKNFKTKFIENFKTEFASYNFDKSSLKDLQLIIKDLSNDNFDFENGVLTITINNWKINKKLEIIYYPQIFIKLDLEKINLYSFEEIYNAKNLCKSNSNIKSCLENQLQNFNIGIEQKIITDENKCNLITFTTKKQFLINNNLNQIKFSFIPK